ncbi:hypothetical protein [Bacillus pumilus]|uniref:hypothetical protein n=1 Tax=Bacillus pumilus TaxID=1408 RepID=UPI0016432CA2|nr:hypothetical protein [Bacillus pumilus]
MEIVLKDKLNITLSLSQEEKDKLMSELNWLVKTYDYNVEMLSDIREVLLKQS